MRQLVKCLTQGLQHEETQKQGLRMILTPTANPTTPAHLLQLQLNLPSLFSTHKGSTPKPSLTHKNDLPASPDHNGPTHPTCPAPMNASQITFLLSTNCY